MGGASAPYPKFVKHRARITGIADTCGPLASVANDPRRTYRLTTGAPAARRVKRVDNFPSRVLEIGEVPAGKLFDREGGLDPKNIDGAVNTTAIYQRQRDRRKAIVLWSGPVEPANEARIANAITPATGFD